MIIVWHQTINIDRVSYAGPLSHEEIDDLFIHAGVDKREEATASPGRAEENRIRCGIIEIAQSRRFAP